MKEIGLLTAELSSLLSVTHARKRRTQRFMHEHACDVSRLHSSLHNTQFTVYLRHYAALKDRRKRVQNTKHAGGDFNSCQTALLNLTPTGRLKSTRWHEPRKAKSIYSVHMPFFFFYDGTKWPLAQLKDIFNLIVFGMPHAKSKESDIAAIMHWIHTAVCLTTGP